MAELIDKNKLLEDIYNNNPQDVMKYIAEYHKCKQSEWIPVNERLPKEETDVLVCNRKGDIEVSRRCVFDDATWEWCSCIWDFDEVIAWMPLPEPYTERKK